MHWPGQSGLLKRSMLHMQAVRAGAQPDAPPSAGRIVIKDPTIIQKQVAAPLGRLQCIAVSSLRGQPRSGSRPCVLLRQLPLLLVVSCSAMVCLSSCTGAEVLDTGLEQHPTGWWAKKLSDALHERLLANACAVMTLLMTMSETVSI